MACKHSLLMKVAYTSGTGAWQIQDCEYLSVCLHSTALGYDYMPNIKQYQ